MGVVLNLVLWGILVLALTGMVIYRKRLDDHDDHTIHLHNDPIDSGIISNQVSVAKRVATMDKAIRYMIILLIAYGLVIAVLAGYQAWINSLAPAAL